MIRIDSRYALESKARFGYNREHTLCLFRDMNGATDHGSINGLIRFKAVVFDFWNFFNNPIVKEFVAQNFGLEKINKIKYNIHTKMYIHTKLKIKIFDNKKRVHARARTRVCVRYNYSILLSITKCNVFNKFSTSISSVCSFSRSMLWFL